MLVQQKADAPSSGKKGSCHECGSVDHWRRDCPRLKSGDGSRPSGGGPSGGGGGNSRPGNSRPANTNNRSGQANSWKTTKGPAKKMVNGRSFEWCDSCKRYTTTHNTETHTGGKKADGAKANIALIEDPSAWFLVEDPTAWLATPVPASAVNISSILAFSLGAVAFSLFGESMGKHASSVGSTMVALLRSVFDFVVASFGDFLDFMGPSLLPSLIVVLLWATSVVLVVWFTRPPPDPEPCFDRCQRRFLHRRRRGRHRKGSSPWRPSGGIRAHGFHRSYPLRLRSSGSFLRMTPRNRQLVRHLQAIREVVDITDDFLHGIKRSQRTARREGENQQKFDRWWKEPHWQGRKGRRGRKYRSESARRRRAHEEQCEINGQNTRRNGPLGAPPPWLKRRQAYRRQAHRPVVACAPAPLPNMTAARDPDPRWLNAKQQAALYEILTSTLSFESAPSPTRLQRLATMVPSWFHVASSKEKTKDVVWDSGASVSVSFDRNDFVGPLVKTTSSTRLNGIANGLKVDYQGHVVWPMQDVNGQLRSIKLPAFLAPGIKQRLLSTTSLLQTYNNEKISMDADRLTLSGDPTDLRTRGPVEARVNPTNNLPTSLIYSYEATTRQANSFSAEVTAVHQANSNLSETEKELLRWHYRLGHLSFRRIQFLMQTGVLARSEGTRRVHTAASKLTHPPMCAACQYGKQTRNPTPGTKQSQVKDQANSLTRNKLMPGEEVSVDHFVCGTKGRLFTSRGRSEPSHMYDGGCIFVDHASGHIDVQFQQHLNSHETLKAKERYESMARDVGVVPQAYRSDNGPAFSSQAFAKKLEVFEQTIKFAGAGAHHQNGVAERAIRTVVSIARTMMIHSAIHWPEVADASLWPMAVQHAAYVYNHVPDPSTGLSPVDLFTRQRWPQSRLLDLHVWGCPVYALHKSLSDGKKLGKWTPRSIRHILMGVSRNHASTIPSLLNPETGAINTAYHVVFDNWFATVPTKEGERPDFTSDTWHKLFGESRYQFVFDDEDLE